MSTDGVWTCSSCGESVPDNMELCWHCGASADPSRCLPALEPRRLGPTCIFCGYNLGGLTSPACPECGNAIPLVLPKAPGRLVQAEADAVFPRSVEDADPPDRPPPTVKQVLTGMGPVAAVGLGVCVVLTALFSSSPSADRGEPAPSCCLPLSTLADYSGLPARAVGFLALCQLLAEGLFLWACLRARRPWLALIMLALVHVVLGLCVSLWGGVKHAH